MLNALHSRVRSRQLAAAGVLITSLALAGCGNDDDATPAAGATDHGGGHSAGSSNTPATSTSFNDTDVTFVTGMKPHHEQAVEMADIVLSKNPPADVAALARQIKAAQAPEIEQLSQMLVTFGPAATAATAAHGAGHGGMMTEEQMAEFKAATGTDAAKMFLEMMIEHHRGAVDAANGELAKGTHEPARTMASNIVKSQTAEIEHMRQLLTQL